MTNQMGRRKLPKCEDFVTPIPPGLENLLQDISTRVLKTKPDNIFCFIADYLEQKLRERNTPDSVVEISQDGDANAASISRIRDNAESLGLGQRLRDLRDLAQRSVDVGTKFAEKYRRAGELRLLPTSIPADPNGEGSQDEHILHQRLNTLSQLLLGIMQRLIDEDDQCKPKEATERTTDATCIHAQLVTQEAEKGNEFDQKILDINARTAQSIDNLICQEVQGLLTQVRNMSIALAHAQEIARALDILGTRRDEIACRGNAHPGTANNATQYSHQGIPSNHEANWLNKEASCLAVQSLGMPADKEALMDEKLCQEAMDANKTGSDIGIRATSENYAFVTVGVFENGVVCGEGMVETVAADAPAATAEKACQPTETVAADAPKATAEKACQPAETVAADSSKGTAEKACQPTETIACEAIVENTDKTQGCDEARAEGPEVGEGKAADSCADEGEANKTLADAEAAVEAEDTNSVESAAEPEPLEPTVDSDKIEIAEADLEFPPPLENHPTGGHPGELPPRDRSPDTDVDSVSPNQDNPENGPADINGRAILGDDAEGVLEKVSIEAAGSGATIVKEVNLADSALVAQDGANEEGNSKSADTSQNSTAPSSSFPENSQQLTVSDSAGDETSFILGQIALLRQIFSGERSVGDCGVHLLLFGTGLVALIGYGAVKGIERFSGAWSRTQTPPFHSCVADNLLGFTCKRLPPTPSCFCRPQC